MEWVSLYSRSAKRQLTAILGDSYASPGIRDFMTRVEDIYPGIFIHSIYVDQDLKKDREASFVSMIWR